MQNHKKPLKNGKEKKKQCVKTKSDVCDRGRRLPRFSSLYTFLTQANRAAQEIQVLLVIPLIGTLIHIKQMMEERRRAVPGPPHSLSTINTISH